MKKLNTEEENERKKCKHARETKKKNLKEKKINKETVNY